MATPCGGLSLEDALENLRSAWRNLEAAAEVQRAALEAQRQQLVDEQRRLDEGFSELHAERQEIQKRKADAERQQQQLSEKLSGASCNGNDVVGLNFGGERVVSVKRSLLQQFEDSMLSCMFSGRYEGQLDRDKDGNVFFDYSPSVMIPLIEHLRLHRDAAPGCPAPLPVIPKEHNSAWASMVSYLGLEGIFTTIFSGIRAGLPVADLRGWTLLESKPYSCPTTMSDFLVPAQETGATALLLGARLSGSDELAIAAMGSVDVITAEKDDSSTQLHNGVHWYCERGKSMGFSPTETVNLGFADVHDPSCSLRLSWHLTGRGGFRAGTCLKLNDSEEWEKVVFAGTVRFSD